MRNIIFNRVFIVIIKVYIIFAYNGDGIIFKINNITGVTYKRGNIGSDIVFALAATDNQRAELFSRNKSFGIIGANNTESKRAFKH